MIRSIPAGLLAGLVMLVVPAALAGAQEAHEDSLAVIVDSTDVHSVAGELMPAPTDSAVTDTMATDTLLTDVARPAVVTASQGDSTAARAEPPVSSGPPPPEPPLYISADNVTGTHGPEGDTVLLNGNVRITRGRTVITSRTGRYLRAQGMLFLDENVEIIDSTTTVTADHVSYSELEDLLQLFGNVTIVDGDATLRAPSGTYNRRTGRADLLVV